MIDGLLIVSVALLVGAALHDIATRTVPNWMPLGLMLAGLGLRLAQGGLPLGLAAAALVFAVAAFCWRRGWMGGADVKLFAACALVVPPGLVAGMILVISIAGGLLAVIYKLLCLGLRLLPKPSRPGRPRGLLARIWRVERRRIRRLESLPYASAIAAGALTTLMMV